MFKLFDRSFFHFAGIFVAILSLSFLLFIVTGFYEMRNQEATAVIEFAR